MNSHDTNVDSPEVLAALFVLGALPDAEAQAFAAQLEAGDESAWTATRDLAPVALRLADDLPSVEPDPQVLQGLLARIDGLSSQPALNSGSYFFQAAAEAAWEETGVAGIRRRLLHLDPDNRRYSALIRFEPGAVYPVHRHIGTEECLMLEGDMRSNGRVLGPGDYERSADSTRHDA